MTRASAATQEPIVSRDRVIDTMRGELRTAIIVQRRMTVEEVSAASGVPVRTIRTYMANDPAEVREPCLSAALSVAVVLGGRAVAALMALIGYSGTPLDEPDPLQPMLLAATAMQHLSTIATAAADGRIDHTEMPGCREAADMLIATVLPLASAGAAT